jgi:hypothetical protein
MFWLCELYPITFYNIQPHWRRGKKLTIFELHFKHNINGTRVFLVHFVIICLSPRQCNTTIQRVSQWMSEIYFLPQHIKLTPYWFKWEFISSNSWQKVIKQREKFPKCIWKGDLLISMNILPVFTYRGGWEGFRRNKNKQTMVWSVQRDLKKCAKVAIFWEKKELSIRSFIFHLLKDSQELFSLLTLLKNMYNVTKHFAKQRAIHTLKIKQPILILVTMFHQNWLMWDGYFGDCHYENFKVILNYNLS